jgi:hypothetical protein
MSENPYLSDIARSKPVRLNPSFIERNSPIEPAFCLKTIVGSAIGQAALRDLGKNSHGAK